MVRWIKTVIEKLTRDLRAYHTAFPQRVILLNEEGTIMGFVKTVALNEFQEIELTIHPLKKG